MPNDWCCFVVEIFAWVALFSILDYVSSANRNVNALLWTENQILWNRKTSSQFHRIIQIYNLLNFIFIQRIKRKNLQQDQLLIILICLLNVFWSNESTVTTLRTSIETESPSYNINCTFFCQNTFDIFRQVVTDQIHIHTSKTQMKWFKSF